MTLCYYPGCRNPGAAVHGMYCAALHKSLPRAEKEKYRLYHRSFSKRGVLTVERSLLKRSDPARKARYAGNDFPTTVARELGEAPELRRVAGCLEARKHLGLNQDDFAALIGKNHSTVEDWEKKKREPPIWLAEMFGAFLGSQAPVGRQEIMGIVRAKGALAACYMIMRNAFDGPRHVSAKTVAPRVAVRVTTPAAAESNRQLVEQSIAECAAARSADPEGYAAIDAATVFYDKRQP